MMNKPVQKPTSLKQILAMLSQGGREWYQLGQRARIKEPAPSRRVS